MEAIITYKPDGQKTARLFDRILTNEILRDICVKVTGQSNFCIERDTSSYNKGRLVIVEHEGVKSYISLSEEIIRGRNSSLQSVPTALNLFYADEELNKRMYYYFIPHHGNAYTNYHKFMYKLLATAGVEFLNIDTRNPIVPYHNVEEMISHRDENRRANAANNSSFISRLADSIHIYAKVYGANKYESTLIALAVAAITDVPIELFNICERDLDKLPASSINTLSLFPNINIHDTSLKLEKQRFLAQKEKTTFRSTAYQFNLHERLENKRCAFCQCEIPEIIQGAHIWNVADIVREAISDDDKFAHSISGHNGLWLCLNHHKLFDANIISLNTAGEVLLNGRISGDNARYVAEITKTQMLPHEIMSDEFIWYLTRRNQNIDIPSYRRLMI